MYGWRAGVRSGKWGWGYRVKDMAVGVDGG